MIKWYLACPICGAIHKCRGTSEVQEKTRSKNIERFKHHSHATINLIPGQAYYTKNDSCAQEEVLKEWMATQQ